MASFWVWSSLSILTFLVFRLRNVGQRPKNYPPGPPTRPLVGNLLQIPRSRPYLQFKRWADEYGPIFSVIAGTRTMIFLNSAEAIKDLFDKRSSIYSSRPDIYVSNLATERMVRMPYGNKWRLTRKLSHNILNAKAARTYDPYQDLESKAMLIGVLDNPDLLFSHLRRFASSIATQMVLGFRYPTVDNPIMRRLLDNLDKWLVVIKKSTPLDLYPILRSLPAFMLPIRRDAERIDKIATDLFDEFWQNVKNTDVENVSVKPSFAADLVQTQSTESFSDKFGAYMCGTLLDAGSDTTNNTLIGFIQAMILFPEVQKEAQATVDRLCGGDARTPAMEDIDNPDAQYIRACVKESLRWMPTGIISFPHATTRDDEYVGYTIPKGAWVFCNTWAIHQNPSRYPNPSQFNPLRYISDLTTSTESASSPDVTQRDHFGFGAGRRICPGMHLVDRVLFLAIARLVWAFDFSKAVDEETGEEITPDPADLIGGIVVKPREFRYRVGVRGEGRERLVREAWGECEAGLLDGEGQWRGS